MSVCVCMCVCLRKKERTSYDCKLGPMMAKATRDNSKRTSVSMCRREKGPKGRCYGQSICNNKYNKKKNKTVKKRKN